MLSKFAGDSALTDDACSAIVDLAGKNSLGISKDARRSALQTAIEKSTNEATTKRAQAMLKSPLIPLRLAGTITQTYRRS